MTVSHILEEVSKAGLTLRLTASGGINARPVDRLTPALRDLLRSHKTDLLTALRQETPAKRKAPPAAPTDDPWPRLEAIANKCCDHWRDSPERRAEMLADLRAMTPDWQRHWIEHLEASYGKPK